MGTLRTHNAATGTIEYYNNSEFNKSFIFTDSSGYTVDLSGKKITFIVKKTKDSTEKLIDISTDIEIALSGSGNNILTPSGEYDLKYSHNVFEFYNDTDDTPLAYGDFIVIKELN